MSTEQIKKTGMHAEDGTGSRSRGKLAAGLLAVFVLIPAAMFAAPHLGGRGYYIAGVLIIIFSMVPFFAQFEMRRPEAREMVMIAVMCGIAVASRAAFIMLPQVKPVIGIIIIAGMAFGPGGGFLTGSLTAFVSNFIFGQGLWNSVADVRIRYRRVHRRAACPQRDNNCGKETAGHDIQRAVDNAGYWTATRSVHGIHDEQRC